MKMRLLLPVILLTMIVSAFAENKPDDAKNIQGTWLPVKAELGGQPMKDEFLKKIVSLKLENGKYEVTAESVDKGTYKLDPATKPKVIDVTGTEGPNTGRTIPAIYELNGDTLRICYNLGGGARPTEFKSPAGTRFFLITYQRQKA